MFWAETEASMAAMVSAPKPQVRRKVVGSVVVALPLWVDPMKRGR
jgi:hypothetical protein